MILILIKVKVLLSDPEALDFPTTTRGLSFLFILLFLVVEHDGELNDLIGIISEIKTIIVMIRKLTYDALFLECILVICQEKISLLHIFYFSLHLKNFLFRSFRLQKSCYHENLAIKRFGTMPEIYYKIRLIDCFLLLNLHNALI